MNDLAKKYINSTVRFFILDELTNHCGKKLTPELVEEIAKKIFFDVKKFISGDGNE
jgi:hypothetical protein